MPINIGPAPMNLDGAPFAWATLAGLKADMDIDNDDQRDDDQLYQVLDAAVAFVRRVRPEFNYDQESDSELPDVPRDIVLGTYRLAGRWHTRRRSPEALVNMGEFGSTRVPSFDPDIERLLGIGRYRGAMFA